MDQHGKLNWGSWRMAVSRSVILWGGTSGISRSFWHALSRSLVAASISSVVTWHRVSWVIFAKRLTATSSIASQQANRKKWSSGRLSIGQLQHPIVGLPRWLFPWRYRQCISAKIEHNSNRCHGEMYFDIVLVNYHQQEKRTPRPTTRQQQGRQGRDKPCSFHCTIWQASHGSHFGQLHNFCHLRS